MRDAHLTRQERFIILWLRFLLVLFLLFGALFVFIPDRLFQYVNAIGLAFFHFKSAPPPYGAREFWWILALGYKGVLAHACFEAQKNWLLSHHFVPIVILGKGISAVGLTLLAFSFHANFFYIVGAGLDGILVLLTSYFYVQALKSRSFISPRTG